MTKETLNPNDDRRSDLDIGISFVIRHSSFVILLTHSDTGAPSRTYWADVALQRRCRPPATLPQCRTGLLPVGFSAAASSPALSGSAAAVGRHPQPRPDAPSLPKTVF